MACRGRDSGSAGFARRRRSLVPVIASLVLMVAVQACQYLPAPVPQPAPSQGPATPGTGTPSPAATTSPQPAISTQTAIGTQPAAGTQPTRTGTPTGAGPSGDFSQAIRNVAQQARPGVVQVTNQQVAVDQFNQAFTIPAGVGSGVIYDDAGHVLTNNHVISGAQSLQVSLPDGRSLPARLVGADPQTDLAVLQVSGSQLPVLRLGRSADLQVGDWVVAIGNALGLPGGPTVTSGVVGALGRTVQVPSESGSGGGPVLFDMIQTDAAINPGNSGGPLVNLASEVIGINTLVAGQAEPGVVAQGIGFAIAIDTAKPIADELVRSGRVVHPYLGIRYAPLSPALAAQLGVNAQRGVIVSQVIAGSPAAAAGLRPRDVIVSIDGTPLVDDSSLARIINSHRPGDTITMQVQRGNQSMNLDARLDQLPSG